MKKTINDIFDEATSSEMDHLISKSDAPDVSKKTRARIKDKAYAKAGLAAPQKKNSVEVIGRYVAAVACLCMMISVVLFAVSIFNFNGESPNFNGESPNENTEQDKDLSQGDGSEENDGGQQGGPSDGGSQGGATKVENSVIKMTIEKNNPGCVAVEDDCFYAFDEEGNLYRVLWAEAENFSAYDRVIVEYRVLEEVNETNPPGEWSVRYQVTALDVKLGAGNMPYLNLSADRLYIELGQSVQFSDYIIDGNYVEIKFASYDSVVDVTVDGCITGQKNGRGEFFFYIANRHGNQTFKMPVSVGNEYFTPLVKIAGHEITTDIGNSFDLHDMLTLMDADEVLFSSDNEDVLTVDKNGVVTAKATGVAHVVIEGANEYGSATDYLTVTVRGNSDDDGIGIQLYENSTTLVIGKTYDFSKNIFQITSGFTFTYSSDDPSVATVTSKGIISAVGAGETKVILHIISAMGNEKATREFTVTVKEPWEPTDPISQEVIAAKDSLVRFETFDWYSSNVANYPEYNIREDAATTAGPVEIWENTLQMDLKFQQAEINATIGYDDMETYNFYFDFYYRPYDEANDRVDYKKATLQPWSIYTDTNAIYRCKFYDQFFVANDGLTEGQLYEVVIVVRQDEEQLGYAESKFTWTDSCAIFTEYALSDPTIIR